MNIILFVAATIAVLSGIIAVTRSHIIHAVLFLDVSFFSLAIVMYALGAPFAAILEVITYAGAIMVVFMYAIMLLNPGRSSMKRERRWQPFVSWTGSRRHWRACFGRRSAYAIYTGEHGRLCRGRRSVRQQVGERLFRFYLPAVEMASVLLLAALVAACYLGKQPGPSSTEKDGPPMNALLFGTLPCFS
jgi:NADH-quinone oxidoreductase subunit J